MTELVPEKADSLAAEFVAAEPNRRINILAGLNDEERMAMLREAAELGYEPAIKLFQA